VLIHHLDTICIEAKRFFRVIIYHVKTFGKNILRHYQILVLTVIKNNLIIIDGIWKNGLAINRNAFFIGISFMWCYFWHVIRYRIGLIGLSQVYLISHISIRLARIYHLLTARHRGDDGEVLTLRCIRVIEGLRIL